MNSINPCSFWNAGLFIYVNELWCKTISPYTSRALSPGGVHHAYCTVEQGQEKSGLWGNKMCVLQWRMVAQWSTGKRRRALETVCEEFCLKAPCKIKHGGPQWAFASIAEIPSKKQFVVCSCEEWCCCRYRWKLLSWFSFSFAWLSPPALPPQSFFLNYICHNILGLLISRFTLSKLFFKSQNQISWAQQ